MELKKEESALFNIFRPDIIRHIIYFPHNNVHLTNSAVFFVTFYQGDGAGEKDVDAETRAMNIQEGEEMPSPKKSKTGGCRCCCGKAFK